MTSDRITSDQLRRAPIGATCTTERGLIFEKQPATGRRTEQLWRQLGRDGKTLSNVAARTFEALAANDRDPVVKLDAPVRA